MTWVFAFHICNLPSCGVEEWALAGGNAECWAAPCIKSQSTLSPHFNLSLPNTRQLYPQRTGSGLPLLICIKKTIQEKLTHAIQSSCILLEFWQLYIAHQISTK